VTSGYPVVSSRTVHEGPIFSVAVDQVRMPSGEVRQRDVVHHPGAVGIVAIDGPDGQERVLLIRQYRHPVRAPLLELPAGLLDLDGEPASVAAARELAEEAGVAAARWDVLIDAFSSSGMSDEAVRIFLARDVRPAPDTGFEPADEEADLAPRWLHLTHAIDQVVAGEITNALCVMGLLAAARSRDSGWSGLRPVDAPWPGRPDHAG